MSRELELARGAGLSLGLIAVRFDDLRPPLRARRPRARSARQRARRGFAPGIDLEHAAIEHRSRAGARRRRLARAPPTPRASRRAPLRCLGGAELEEPAQIVAPVFAAEQLVERRDRFVVARVFLDELPVRRDRLVEPAELGGVATARACRAGCGDPWRDPLLLLEARLTASTNRSHDARGARGLLELVEPLLVGREIVGLARPWRARSPVTEPSGRLRRRGGA